MKKYEPKEIRNIVLVGQRGVGKTSLGEAFLFQSKVNNRLCSVDDGTSTFDFEPEEQKRHSTINSATAWLEWGGCKINVLDTPGASDFLNDTRMSVEVADGAFVLVGATDGVQVGTEKVWAFTEGAGLATAVLVTGMDKERANFEEAVKDVKETLTRRAVPVFLPIGKEAGFKGVVNLLRRKAYLYDEGKVTEAAIPADMDGAVSLAMEALMEVVAETDDELMMKYLDTMELSSEEIQGAFPNAVRSGKLVPILCGSSKKLIGIDSIMDFIAEYFPSPEQRKPFLALDGEKPIEISVGRQKFSGLVFKSFTADIGRISLFRVISGGLDSDSTFNNATQQKKERCGQLYVLRGKKRDNAEALAAGDIGAMAKLKFTFTGDSLTDEAESFLFQVTPPPSPVAVVAVHPKSKADEDKLGSKLNDIVQEDPALKVWRDPETSERLLGGMGQMHLDVVIEKLRNNKVEVETTLPRIPYRETITKKCPSTEGKHKKQSGGRGQFGVCFIELEPIAADAGLEFEFVDKIFGGAIPKQWIPSVEKGIRNRMGKGVIAGYPVINVRVNLLDGKYHDVDSSDAAFQMAGSKGFQAAVKLAGPVLLEPIYNLQVTVPQDYMGAIMGDITSKRGRPLGSEQKGKLVTINAQVPLAEIQKYSADLESMTSGRGTFTMNFLHYERVPAEIAQKIISSAKMEEEEE